MKLNKNGIKDYSAWEANQVEVPKFNYDEMLKKTNEEPRWIHFGAGNIFRGFIAALQQNLLNSGKADSGIIVAETFDYEIIDKVYKPFDNLSLLVHLNPDGSLEKKIIASVSESLAGDTARTEDWERLQVIFRKPSLQIASFTVTEKGYSLTGMTNDFLPDVVYDMEHGFKEPKSLIAKTASLLYSRFLAGAFPVAMVSMDNCSHNGDLLKKSIQTLIQKWVDNGIVEKEFFEYINDPSKVSFPCSMIDKITPRPSETVNKALVEMGLENTEIIRTSRNTYISQFVNAEKPQYLVIEDQFPNGRMPLEDAGVYFTDKITVENVERMKVTTCLNPLHTALAVFGCLLGYTLIADEMKNPQLRKLVENIGYKEGMPVVINPGIIEPQAFIDEVINQRFPNPYIPDTPQRIACDTSQKIPVRFGETIKTYVSHPTYDVKSLTYIPLVIAGWCRYLMGIDDNGNAMELSPDPMLEQLKVHLQGIELGKAETFGEHLKPLLSNDKIFGVNLYSVGLGEKIEGYFKELIAGKDAVKNVLEKYVK